MNCPDCNSPLCEYKEENIIMRICWNCGYYESMSQAFKECSYLFKDIVRNNPSHFIKRFLLRNLSDGFLQRKKSDKDLTEPDFALALFLNFLPQFLFSIIEPPLMCAGSLFCANESWVQAVSFRSCQKRSSRSVAFFLLVSQFCSLSFRQELPICS